MYDVSDYKIGKKRRWAKSLFSITWLAVLRQTWVYNKMKFYHLIASTVFTYSLDGRMSFLSLRLLKTRVELNNGGLAQHIPLLIYPTSLSPIWLLCPGAWPPQEGHVDVGYPPSRPSSSCASLRPRWKLFRKTFYRSGGRGDSEATDNKDLIRIWVSAERASCCASVECTPTYQEEHATQTLQMYSALWKGGEKRMRVQ